MPTSNSYPPSQVLSGFAIRYRNQDYIADQVSPVREVDSRSQTFYRMGDTEEFDEYETESGDEGAVGESKGERTPDSFKARPISHQAFLSTEAEEEGDLVGFNERMLETERVTGIVDRKQEIELANKLSTASNYPGMTSTPAVKWGTATVAQLMADINAGVDLLNPAGGGKLQLVLGLQPWRALSMNVNVIANVTPTRAITQLKEAEVAALIGVDEIVVGKAMKTTKIKKKTTRTRIWGNIAILHYVNPNPSLTATGHVVTFRKKVKGLATRVYEIEEPKRGADGGVLIKVSRTQDLGKIIDADAGYLWTAVAA